MAQSIILFMRFWIMAQMTRKLFQFVVIHVHDLCTQNKTNDFTLTDVEHQTTVTAVKWHLQTDPPLITQKVAAA
jgi:hypothetical protein